MFVCGKVVSQANGWLLCVVRGGRRGKMTILSETRGIFIDALPQVVLL